MIWLDSIYKLQYYNPIAGVPCFCTELTQPEDMQLQGILSGRNPYTVTLYTYSADGLTQLQNITTSFAIYTARTTDGRDYFNAKLQYFTQSMCSNKCFIIRAVVTSNGVTIFDKYTERYCVNSCCITATGVTFQQDGIVITSGDTTPVIPASTTPPVSECGNPLIRIISKFDCIDSFTGNFFGTPQTVYSGTADWTLTMVTTLQGRIVRRPRDIRREISYNCRLQKTETEPTYLIESYDFIPAWKMYEIEGQFCANNLWVDDFTSYTQYVFPGGTIFRKVDGANSCTEIFKLETTLQGCTQRQIFGCAENCISTTTGYLIVPSAYNGGSWYDESGMLIATTFDGSESSPYVPGLLDWLRNQDGIDNVELLDLTGTTCEDYTYAIVLIDGTSTLPTSVYMDSAIASNRLFVRTGDTESELCDYVGPTPCAKPVNGTVVISSLACSTPVNGTVIIESITPTELTILAISPWVAEAAPDTEASIIGAQVTFSIEATKTVAASNGDDYTILAEQFATISNAGWPSDNRQLDSTNTGGLTGDQIVTIGTNGIITVSGTFPITVDNELTFNFDNFTYNV